MSFEIDDEVRVKDVLSGEDDILLGVAVVLDDDWSVSKLPLGKSEPLGKRLFEEAEEVICTDEQVLGLSFWAPGISSVSSQKVDANVSSEASKH